MILQMENTSVTISRAREVFSGKKVLIVGDSISRSIYKDLACLLWGFDRLLTVDELRFNRCNNGKHALFGEVIELFQVDRSNSRNNLERRKIISDEHNYRIYYSFCSRIWNKSIEQLLSSIAQFDIIFIQSSIWDLSKYFDKDGKVYLRNIDICLSNLMKINKNVVWISLPPPHFQQSSTLNDLIRRMYKPTTDILNYYGCKMLDLYQLLANTPNIRSRDGVHFTPNGHRLISSRLVEYMSCLNEDITSDLTAEPSTNGYQAAAHRCPTETLPPSNDVQVQSVILKTYGYLNLITIF